MRLRRVGNAVQPIRFGVQAVVDSLDLFLGRYFEGECSVERL